MPRTTILHHGCHMDTWKRLSYECFPSRCRKYCVSEGLEQRKREIWWKEDLGKTQTIPLNNRHLVDTSLALYGIAFWMRCLTMEGLEFDKMPTWSFMHARRLLSICSTISTVSPSSLSRLLSSECSTSWWAWAGWWSALRWTLRNILETVLEDFFINWVIMFKCSSFLGRSNLLQGRKTGEYQLCPVTASASVTLTIRLCPDYPVFTHLECMWTPLHVYPVIFSLRFASIPLLLAITIISKLNHRGLREAWWWRSVEVHRCPIQ